MKFDKDPYKSKGQITLKIEKFSEFANKGPKIRRLSDPVYIRGLPWKILATSREMGSLPKKGDGSLQKCLGYFLQCNTENTDPSWNCSGSAKLKILTKKPEKNDHVRKISHVFNAKENDWGFAQFMTFEEIMDPEEGWYDEEADTLILSVDVIADALHVNSKHLKMDEIDDDVDCCSNSICSVHRQELNEKIKSLELEVLEVTNLLKEKTDKQKLLTVYVKCFNKINNVSDNWNCCGQNCWKETTGYCKEGNGVVWICNDGALIKYSHSTKNMESDNLIMLKAEKEFKRADIPSEIPENAYVLRFFEVTALPDNVKENEFKWFNWEMQLGLYKNNECYFRLCSDGYYRTADGTEKQFLNCPIVGGDVFGCGHILPPKNKPKEKTQIFFTLNKKQIGKTILLDEIEDLFPHVAIKRCDVRLNFGNDDNKSFIYDIENHEAGE